MATQRVHLFAQSADDRYTNFCREHGISLRYDEHGVTESLDRGVPKVPGYGDELSVIESAAVKRPSVGNRAGAFLDRALDFFEEAMAEWRLE